jgi:hypothetical protein
MTKETVRAALKAADDGMTIAELAWSVSRPDTNVKKSLAAMPDAYIDHWRKAKRGPHKYAAVYMVVDVPENAPKPN